jgi:hypothetical protein
MLSFGKVFQSALSILSTLGTSHRCVHDNCHLNNCAESPVLKMPKMPKVPKMPKIVERAFSTIDFVSNRQ